MIGQAREHLNRGNRPLKVLPILMLLGSYMAVPVAISIRYCNLSLPAPLGLKVMLGHQAPRDRMTTEP